MACNTDADWGAVSEELILQNAMPALVEIASLHQLVPGSAAVIVIDNNAITLFNVEGVI